MCAICMCILVEPVTLPCKHEMCMSCFRSNVTETSLTCPMCRTRISTWTRRATKSNRLVNTRRWNEIKEAFPHVVKRRLEGEEEDISEDELPCPVFPVHHIAQPGEIRQEYEKELEKIQKQREQEQKQETEASLQLILKLEKEERERLMEVEQIKLRDEALAKELSDKLAKSEDILETPNITHFLKERQESTTPRTGMKNLTVSRGQRDTLLRYLSPVSRSANNNKQSLRFGGIRMETDTLQSKSTLSASCSGESQIFHNASPASRSAPFMCGGMVSAHRLSAGSELQVEETPAQSVSTCNSIDLWDDFNPDPIVKESEVLLTDLAGVEPVKEVQHRSSSIASNDSITQELSHFKPIESCPRTPPRRLPGGCVVEAPVIRSTPIKMSRCGTQSPVNQGVLSGLLSAGPVITRRLHELAAERQANVKALSKSTSTEFSSKNYLGIKQATHYIKKSSSKKQRTEDLHDALPLLPLEPKLDDYDNEDFIQVPTFPSGSGNTGTVKTSGTKLSCTKTSPSKVYKMSPLSRKGSSHKNRTSPKCIVRSKKTETSSQENPVQLHREVHAAQVISHNLSRDKQVVGEHQNYEPTLEKLQLHHHVNVEKQYEQSEIDSVSRRLYGGERSTSGAGDSKRNNQNSESTFSKRESLEVKNTICTRNMRNSSSNSSEQGLDINGNVTPDKRRSCGKRRKSDTCSTDTADLDSTFIYEYSTEGSSDSCVNKRRKTRPFSTEDVKMTRSRSATASFDELKFSDPSRSKSVEPLSDRKKLSLQNIRVEHKLSNIQEGHSQRNSCKSSRPKESQCRTNLIKKSQNINTVETSVSTSDEDDFSDTMPVKRKHSERKNSQRSADSDNMQKENSCVHISNTESLQKKRTKSGKHSRDELKKHKSQAGKHVHNSNTAIATKQTTLKFIPCKLADDKNKSNMILGIEKNNQVIEKTKPTVKLFSPRRTRSRKEVNSREGSVDGSISSELRRELDSDNDSNPANCSFTASDKPVFNESSNDSCSAGFVKTRNPDKTAGVTMKEESAEGRDRRLALQLQAQFDAEAKFGFSAIRLKGSEGEYELRQRKTSTADYNYDCNLPRKQKRSVNC